MTYKQFFGRTWIGPSKRFFRENGHLNYNECVYFCSPIKDEHILLVVEIVGKLQNGKLKSFGWSALRPFSSSNYSDYSDKRFVYHFMIINNFEFLNNYLIGLDYMVVLREHFYL